MGSHEARAQNPQPVEQLPDPATGTTRREPHESACMGASTGAVALPGGTMPFTTEADVRRIVAEARALTLEDVAAAVRDAHLQSADGSDTERALGQVHEYLIGL